MLHPLKKSNDCRTAAPPNHRIRCPSSPCRVPQLVAFPPAAPGMLPPLLPPELSGPRLQAITPASCIAGGVKQAGLRGHIARVGIKARVEQSKLASSADRVWRRNAHSTRNLRGRARVRARAVCVRQAATSSLWLQQVAGRLARSTSNRPRRHCVWPAGSLDSDVTGMTAVTARSAVITPVTAAVARYDAAVRALDLDCVDPAGHAPKVSLSSRSTPPRRAMVRGPAAIDSRSSSTWERAGSASQA